MLLGFLLIDQNFAAMWGHSDITMKASLSMPFFHIGACTVLIYYLDMRLKGCGIAMLCTLSVAYITQNVLIQYRIQSIDKDEENIEEAFEIGTWGGEVDSNFWHEFKKGVPNVLITAFRWISFFSITFAAGTVGPAT